MTRRVLTFLLITLSFSTALQAQIITTIAGTYVAGHSGDGGPATAARMTDPFGIAVDSRGNVYVAEYNTYVRKIDRKGIITTFAGVSALQPPPYGDGGPATAAYLDNITDLAFDAADNLYIVDHGHARIRKVDNAGIISTIAGGGASTLSGVPATLAKMPNVTGITVDAAGNIYLTDKEIVRKINTTGYVSTIAGNGSSGYNGDGGNALLASITYAYDVAVDKAGNVYFSDWKNYSIRKISTSGVITTIAGDGSGVGAHSGDGGPASAALFDSPWGIAMDGNDNLFICDALNGVIRKIDLATGIITHIAGTPKSSGSYGDGGLAAFAGCGSRNIAIDCGNNLFLTNYLFVRKVTYQYHPAFTANDSLITCQNYKGVPIDTLLNANDIDVAKPMTWTVDVAPAHGTIGGAGYTTGSINDTVTPVGLSYTPAPGYTGIDSFTMQVGDCSQVADWRKVYVRVRPSPLVAAITAPDTLCTGLSTTLVNPTPGGVWSNANTAIATVLAADVSALSPGVDTVYYAVTGGNSCITTIAHKLQVIICPVGVKQVAPGAMAISVYPNPAGSVLHIDGLKAGAHYKLLSVVGAVMSEGTLAAGNSTISAGMLANGIYVLEIVDPASGLITTRKIVKE